MFDFFDHKIESLMQIKKNPKEFTAKLNEPQNYKHLFA